METGVALSVFLPCQDVPELLRTSEVGPRSELSHQLVK